MASLKIITDALPATARNNQSDNGYPVTLFQLLNNPTQTVSTLLEEFCTGPTGHSFSLATTLTTNLHVSDKRKPEQKPQPLWPEDNKQSIAQTYTSYLAATPFLDVFRAPMRFAIPAETRHENTLIVGGAGHGKTQLLLAQILADLENPDKPTIIIMESQQDLIRDVLNDARFAIGHPSGWSERLIYIDPTPVGQVFGVNLFDFEQDCNAFPTPEDYRDAYNDVIDGLTFIFEGILDAPMTPTQTMMFRFVCDLLIQIPQATIYTMLDVLKSDKPYTAYISKLDPTAQAFFVDTYNSRRLNPRREELAQRIWMLLSNPILKNLFSAPRSTLSLSKAMQDGAIILINTAKSSLKEEGCRFYGRFWLSQILRAALTRANIKKNQRKSIYLTIDEAHDYLGDFAGPMFAQLRKYHCATTIATQATTQIPNRLMSIILANTAIKIAGGLSAKDAHTLSEDMRTSPDHLLSIKKDPANKFANYALSLKTMPHPVTIRLDYPYLNPPPPIGDAELRRTLTENKKRYYLDVADLEAKALATVSEPSPDTEPDSPRRPPPSRPKPEVTQATPHRKLQEEFHQLATSLGLLAQLEKSHKEYRCRADLAITHHGMQIAVQVALKNKVGYEVDALKRLVEAGYDTIILTSPDASHLQAIADKAADALPESIQGQLCFLEPDRVRAWITALLPPGQKPKGSPYTKRIVDPE